MAKDEICPVCNTPLNDVPFDDCSYHWVENLAWQRENNAVVSLNLRDVKAIRDVLNMVKGK